MRKEAVVTIMAMLFVFIFRGYGKDYSYEEKTLETVVIECEEGEYHPDAYYMSMANMYLAEKNMGLWSMYKNLANTNGKYDYNIIISIDGNNYTVIRKEPYDAGAYITITEVKTYKENKLIKTEYK